MRPWAPPPVSVAVQAIEPAREEAPFVFHDPAGRRWSRIKRAGLVAAAALVVLGGGVLVAVTQEAPGRAPALAGTPTQSVPDWQVRDSSPGAGGPTAPGPTAPGTAGGAAAGTRSTPASGQVPTPRPSPTPTQRPSRRPTPTPKPKPTSPTPLA